MKALHNIDMYNFGSQMKSTVTFSLNTHQIFPLCISNYQEQLKKFMEHYPTWSKLLTGSLTYQGAASWQVKAEGSKLTFRSAVCSCFRCLLTMVTHTENSVLTWQWNVSFFLLRPLTSHLHVSSVQGCQFANLFFHWFSASHSIL